MADVTTAPPDTRRRVDLDVVRAVALIGVVTMNYHGYLLIRSNTFAVDRNVAERILDPWSGPLSTRFAATFCFVAGMGVTLMTRRSRVGSPAERRVDRLRLARRGLLLYCFGAVLDWIWPGTIIFYYGAMFLVAALIFSLSTRVLVGLAAVVAAASTVLRIWAANADDAGWLGSPGERSPSGLLYNTFYNGTHPLLPWLVFFIAGIVLARFLPMRTSRRLLLAAIGAAMVVYGYAFRHVMPADTATQEVFTSTYPFTYGPNYLVVTLGSTLVAWALIGLVAERFRSTLPVQVLAAAGRTTLTLYVAHVLTFNLVVDWLEWVRPTGLDTALLFAGSFWLVAVVAAWAWQRRFGPGPLERVYRAFSD